MSNIEWSGEREDFIIFWQGDNQKWVMYYEIHSGSGMTRTLEDGEEITIRRVGDQYAVMRND